MQDPGLSIANLGQTLLTPVAGFIATQPALLAVLAQANLIAKVSAGVPLSSHHGLFRTPRLELLGEVVCPAGCHTDAGQALLFHGSTSLRQTGIRLARTRCYKPHCWLSCFPNPLLSGLQAQAVGQIRPWTGASLAVSHQEDSTLLRLPARITSCSHDCEMPALTCERRARSGQRGEPAPGV